MNDIQPSDMKMAQFIENENDIRNDFSINYHAMIKMGQSAMWTAFLTNFISLIILCVLYSINIPTIITQNLFELVEASYFLSAGFFFGCGVITSLTSFGVTYLSQECWLDEFYLQLPNSRRASLYNQSYDIKFSKRVKSLQTIATSLVCGAYIFFVLGLIAILYSMALILQFSLFISGAAIVALISFCFVVSWCIYSSSKKDN